MSSPSQRRLLILASKLGYQTRAFVNAARKLGLEIVFGTDRCDRLEDPWGDHAIALKFEHPDESARKLLAAEVGPIHAVVSLGDRPTPTAARVAAALDLPHHSAAAADVCRDKYRSREILRGAGLRVPRFIRLPLEGEEDEMLREIEAQIGFPCVLKPLALSGSRGVIRANTSGQARKAWQRIHRLMTSPDVRALREDTSGFIQVESYVDGIEVAAEAVVDRGTLRILAIFDKPDPLQGPFFEETIYLTPSRLPPAAQQVIGSTLEQGVRALGLTHGPVHAEFRVDDIGAWPMEVAARCIGGLCSKALRFTRGGGFELCTLEEIIIRLALGEPLDSVTRERAASGVMMIPIPESGIYLGVDGVQGSRSVAGIDEVIITAKEDQTLVPLPEGGSYLGFIFSHALHPEQVEAALRQAHSRLRFKIGAELPVV